MVEKEKKIHSVRKLDPEGKVIQPEAWIRKPFQNAAEMEAARRKRMLREVKKLKRISEGMFIAVDGNIEKVPTDAGEKFTRLVINALEKTSPKDRKYAAERGIAILLCEFKGAYVARIGKWERTGWNYGRYEEVGVEAEPEELRGKFLKVVSRWRMIPRV